MESVYEIARWIWERDSEVNVWLQQRGTIPCWVFLMQRDAKLEKCIRGFRAAALISLLAKWYVVAWLSGSCTQNWSRLNGKSCMVVPRGFS